MIGLSEVLNGFVKRLGKLTFLLVHATTLSECRGVSSILLPIYGKSGTQKTKNEVVFPFSDQIHGFLVSRSTFSA